MTTPWSAGRGSAHTPDLVQCATRHISFTYRLDMGAKVTPRVRLLPFDIVELSLTTGQAVALVIATALALVAGLALGAPRGLAAPAVATIAIAAWTTEAWPAAITAVAGLLATLVGAVLVGRDPAEADAERSPAEGTTRGGATRTWVNPDSLTPREIEVLTLVAQGRSNDEVAAALVVSISTVKTHINNLFSKTGVRDRSQAVRYAYEQGLVAPPGGGNA
jgi:DNA-binding CsgD family transcriptional regulator